MASAHDASLLAAAETLASARRVFVVTGAGISAESGLPTYRGVGGLYEGTGTEDGIEIEEALSGQMLRARPAVTWKYVAQIERAVRSARPSAAHTLLAAFEERFDHLLLVTQNVDGLHRAAGSTNVLDLHGDLHDLLCTGCGARHTVESYAHLEPLPRCEKCGAVLRPDVVLFGEMLPAAKIARLNRELEQGFDVYLSIGTSSVFSYIAAPILAAARAGRPTIEINPALTILSDEVQLKLPIRAGEALGRLRDRLFT